MAEALTDSDGASLTGFTTSRAVDDALRVPVESSTSRSTMPLRSERVSMRIAAAVALPTTDTWANVVSDTFAVTVQVAPVGQLTWTLCSRTESSHTRSVSGSP